MCVMCYFVCIIYSFLVCVWHSVHELDDPNGSKPSVSTASLSQAETKGSRQKHKRNMEWKTMPASTTYGKGVWVKNMCPKAFSTIPKAVHMLKPKQRRTHGDITRSNDTDDWNWIYCYFQQMGSIANVFCVLLTPYIRFRCYASGRCVFQFCSKASRSVRIFSWERKLV